jgi:hypothetical protein
MLYAVPGSRHGVSSWHLLVPAAPPPLPVVYHAYYKMNAHSRVVVVFNLRTIQTLLRNELVNVYYSYVCCIEQLYLPYTILSKRAHNGRTRSAQGSQGSQRASIRAPCTRRNQRQRGFNARSSHHRQMFIKTRMQSQSVCPSSRSGVKMDQRQRPSRSERKSRHSSASRHLGYSAASTAHVYHGTQRIRVRSTFKLYRSGFCISDSSTFHSPTLYLIHSCV